MLTHPIFDKLRSLKLQGMLQSLQVQMQNAEYQKLSFEERFGLLVDNEEIERDNRRLKNRLKKAMFRQNACMENIDYRTVRKLDKSLMCALETCQWITNKKNVLIVGATGTGKTHMAEALAHKACMEGHASHNLRLPKFFNELTLAKADGSYIKQMKALTKFDVLILDDFGIHAMTSEQRRDLLEIVEERHNLKSTIITSQLPINQWHEAIGDSTLADAIMDRVVHNAYRIELEGESMRKVLANCDRKEILLSDEGDN